VGCRSLAWDPGGPANAGGWAAARDAPGCGQGEVEAAGWKAIEMPSSSKLRVFIHGGLPVLISAIRQRTSLATPCAAGRRLDPAVPTSWDDAVQSMVL
jgi:hypothetical protein